VGRLAWILAPILAACDPAPPPRLPDPPGTARISGRVLFRGTHQRPVVLIPAGDCKHHYGRPPLKEDIVAREDGGLRDVLVYVKEGLSGAYTPPADPVAIDQKACAYVPHVAAAMAGQDIVFLNSDDTYHNVHIMARVNSERNFSMDGRGRRALKAPFDKPELRIPIGCDQHSWMDARLHILPHPKFAVTGEDGRFEIAGLPAGRYLVAALHDVLGELTAKVEFEEGGTREGLEFAFEKR
jgi:plastocyanin